MESSAHGPLENLRSIERKIDGLQDFKLKFGHIEEALTKLQASISSQTVLLEAVQAQVGLKETQEIQQFMIARDSETEVPVPSASDATMVTPPAPAMSRPVSILKKKVRPEDEVDPVPLPKQPPQTFSVIPGQVNEMNQERRLSVASERSRRSRQSTEANQKGQGRRTSLVSLVSQSPDSLSGRRNQVLLDFSKPCSMDDLTVKTTRKLLRGFSALSACPLDESGRSEASATGSGRSGSKTSSREAVLEKTQNLCLDELRANHNAVVTAMSMRSIAPLDTTGGMPFTAELLLVFAGILQWSPRLSMLWVWCLLVLFLGSSGALAWFSGVAGLLEADITITSVSYMAGIAASIWMLRRTDIQELLKDDESSLDSYARQAGFIKQWRQKSRKRFIEAIGCLVLICASRCLVYVQVPVSLHDLVLTSAYCFASVAFVAVAYLQLHVLKGLELAIDSFSVQFFRDMDFEKALNEWNVLQALLRHVSTKLSGSLLMLGFSSGVSILYLIELSFVRADVPGGFQFILQNLWSLPPIMMCLYTLTRAAAVTEKASRVSPLVNSWTFDSEEVEEEYEWMDLARQYLVQYISQSEAGFYMQGVRIRIFQVSKMCYYLGAVLFAVASQMTV